ncbi:MAG: hypothetical protein F6K10_02650 [Moorea sp. SIO2B7]|nr:hypothetical protein [Moorena sp. SIO2B7]
MALTRRNSKTGFGNRLKGVEQTISLRIMIENVEQMTERDLVKDPDIQPPGFFYPSEALPHLHVILQNLKPFSHLPSTPFFPRQQKATPPSRFSIIQ